MMCIATMERFLALTTVVAIMQVCMTQTVVIVSEADDQSKREMGNATTEGTLQHDDPRQHRKLPSDDPTLKRLWLVAFVACTSSMGVILFAYALLATVCQKKSAPVTYLTEIKTEKAAPPPQEEKTTPETEDVSCSTAELFSSAQSVYAPQK
ncbi:hypothetical protein M514_07032 [Trichuris suis]|uniref:Uncharacterized protein n=1 Tax=Trichuris suis TaxID=68888 RepID=A0A085N8U1_9BILA|nr:hypothetical protein M513_07032 [Trichuris suis]KFD65887.1 hypothetical protein M514_07032 [Trichuris suis]